MTQLESGLHPTPWHLVKHFRASRGAYTLKVVDTNGTPVLLGMPQAMEETLDRIVRAVNEAEEKRT